MKLKQKAQDFRVRELLAPGYLRERGRFRVYCVTKKKLTSLEAAARLADMAGVRPSDVGMAGLKDRQGVTVQFMSVAGGRPVFLKTPELRIEVAGFASAALSSSSSLGNAFEITVRGLDAAERAAIESGLEEVREHGLPNYFGEQRFGNLRHGQGWIARELALGRHEAALRMLMCGRSEHDDARNTRFKADLDEAWGDWRECREIAGRFGQHISVFQHLARNEGDFAGAFTYVKSQLRLIHLYAWQSHLWNRAVAAYVEEVTTPSQRFVVQSEEGPLVFARGALPIDAGTEGQFRLPGPGLEDVRDRRQHDLLALALRREELEPHQFRIEGVSGFALKGEDRPLVVRPRNLKARTDATGRVIVEFELPRGAYATLVMARLVPPGLAEALPRERARATDPRDTGGRDRRPSSTGAHDHRPSDTGGRDRRPSDTGGRDRRPGDTGGRDRRPMDAGGRDRRPSDPGRHDRPRTRDGSGSTRPRRDSAPERGPRTSASSRPPRADAAARREHPPHDSLRPSERASPAPRGGRHGDRPSRPAHPRPGATKGGKMRPADPRRKPRPRRDAPSQPDTDKEPT